MKISYADYIKKSDVSVLVAEAIFSELEHKYPLKKIGEVAETTSGGTPSRGNSDYYNGDIPWLKSGELNDSEITEAEEFITEKGLANSSAKLHPEETLLLAMYGATAGKTGITKFKAATNQAVCAIFPNSKVKRDYLFWFFRQHRHKFIEMSKGGAQPNISQSLIKETLLPLPDKETQESIVSILNQIQQSNSLELSIIPDEFKGKVVKVFFAKNSVSDITTELTHQLDLVKQLRQSFLREAMQGKLVAPSNDGETGQQLLEKIKAEKAQLIAAKKLKKEKDLSPIKAEEIPFAIPEHWTWCRLGELVDLVTSGSRDWAKYYSSEGATFVRMGNLSRESFNLRMNNIQYVNPPKNQEGNRTRLLEGDILVSITGEVGNLGLIPKDFGEAYINQHTALVRLNKLMVTKFICHLLLSDSVQQQFNAPQRGLKNSFRLSDIDLLIIPLPPLFEQQRIVEKLESLMQTCDALEASIKSSQVQNQQLLQQVLREALRK